MSKKPTVHLSKKKVHAQDVSSVVLTAVALQDHLSRTLSLGSYCGPKQIGLGPAARAKQKREVKPVVDTGRSKGIKRRNDDKKEREYVLDEKPPPLTLAQKFGLVNAPKQLLSEQEWTHVKAKSNERDDSKEPCVICKEDFGLQEQVLLSCTHVFHRACLQAFERFTGKKTCPMCRHEQYQTRVIHEGARLHKHRCATKIQSWWRGYVVRCWYKQLRQTVPPKDPKLRKKFYEEKLTAIVDRMIKSIDVNMAEFMREIDASVQLSRDIFSQWDAVHNEISAEDWEAIQLKAVLRGEVDCPICLTELQLASDLHLTSTDDKSSNSSDVPLGFKKDQPAPKYSTAGAENKRKNTDKKLLEKLSRQALPDFKGQTAVEHSRESVPFKPNPLASSTKMMATRARSTVLLSCTHVFHTTCLRTLEELAMADLRNTCPVCRAHSQKKVITY
ncbi:RING finger protein 32-like isoform X2 [Physella acuta]|uniref:RING finger protein 32-like isoform X2 n=1 Tax=Physella acuta TaxID=109671 RepID=UPI0027DD7B23|nr:RING finger protein 32-like isoform X2 [Physella acuta]